MDRLEWRLFDDGGLGPDRSTGYLEPDEPLVLAARSALARVFQLTRAGAEKG
jgi:hypothetical protein